MIVGEKILKKLLDRRFEDFTFNHYLLQQSPVCVVQITATTHKRGKLKYYFARNAIHREDLNRDSLRRVVEHTAGFLNTFLVMLCDCVPGPNGEWGEYCLYHQAMNGQPYFNKN